MIYFAQNPTGGSIKIGTATLVSRRLISLRSTTGHTELAIIGVIDGGHTDEAALHRRFSHLHLEGEWFAPDAELLQFISENARAWDGDPDAPVRVMIDISDRIRRTIAVAAASKAVSTGVIVEALVEEAYPDILERIDHVLATEPTPIKRGRRPKS